MCLLLSKKFRVNEMLFVPLPNKNIRAHVYGHALSHVQTFFFFIDTFFNIYFFEIIF
jgi:hypothetical protein